MSRVHIFSDEAGDFSFVRDARASKYFLVCTVLLPDCTIGDGLSHLRRDMVWRRLPVEQEFHASEDKNIVREEVYRYIASQPIRVDATLLEKCKAQPQARASKETFYRYAWYFHFKHVGPKLLRTATEAQITAAALGTRKGQAVYTAAVNDVVTQTIPGYQWATFFPHSVAEPCLQIADYCAWAIQRKWEKGDTVWYEKISHLIKTEYDLWRRGSTHYY